MSLVNEKMEQLGNVRSAIRDLFEYGLQQKKLVGREYVFDFSLGNPGTPAPDSVQKALLDLVKQAEPVALHGYTTASGIEDVRKVIAEGINERFHAGVHAADIYMTCGASAALTISLSALKNDGDEFIVFAPFFPEYRVFIEMTGAKCAVVPADLEKFEINFDELEKVINPHTKAVIVNSPNNPTGVVLSRKTIDRLTDFLRKKEEEYGHPVFLISDEPYRELVYDDIEVPYFVNEYDDTIVCYSFSKSLSLPGERIGYLLVSPKCAAHDRVYAACAGAGRALGYVCAPAMMQQVIGKCSGQTANLNFYRKNRDLLYNGLTKLGYECVYPDGAFYLFMKSPIPDAKAFMERAKKYELLLVPSDSFGVTGYLRLAYCVETETIVNSLPAFEKLIKEFQ